MAETALDLNEQLIQAAQCGDLATVERLLRRGAHVNSRGKAGETTLMRAAVTGHSEVARLLIAKGAGVNAQDEIGPASWQVAAPESHEAVETWLPPNLTSPAP